jgi:hypothetical protein
MSTDYAGHARKIIKDSIISSIYIDDEIVEPFSSPEGGKEAFYTISKGLYESFRKENKSLDFYKFNKRNDWTRDKDYLFKHRDLLILDWQLNGINETRQEETLQILKHAVINDNIHFISVYTATEPGKFDDIFYTIKAYFTIGYSEDSQKKYEELVEALDNGGAETDKFKSLGNSFKRYTLSPLSNKTDMYDSLKAEIRDLLGEENYRLFARSLKTIHSDIATACEIVGFCMNTERPRQADGMAISANTNFIGEKFIVINHTILHLSHKSAPEPQELFSFFTDAVLRVCGNLLTLISLEIRNLLRESSGFIGKDADSISDAILFHQRERKEAFFDVLMSIIRNHTSSHFDYKTGRLSSLTDGFWTAYDQKKSIQETVIALKGNNEALHQELIKLNVYYNELHIKKSGNDIIKFGDVFLGLNTYNKPDGRYFLCTTAHCDCLNPKINIKNNFYFIMGQKYKTLKEALDKGDDGHHSFIRLGGEIVAIEWNTRPLILNIQDNKIRNLVATDGTGTKYSLVYATTLKENYAQRMANNSFSFPMRVGIDFASL